MQQTSNIWNNLSIVGQYGMNSSLSPNERITTSGYSDFKFFQFGINLSYNDILGVRGTFSSSDFKRKDLDNLGVTYSKLMLEENYNVLRAINQGKSSSDFEVTAQCWFRCTHAFRSVKINICKI